MRAIRRSVALVVVICAASGGQVSAQQRTGLMGGVSLGAGALNVSGTASDPAAELVGEAGDQGVDTGFNMYLGFSTSPRTAVLIDLALVGLAEGVVVDGEVRVGANRITFPSATSSHTSLVLAGALQYWPTSKVWLRGGLGVGTLDRDLVVEAVDLTVTLNKGTGFATLVATGVDFWRRGNFAMDAQFHYAFLALNGLRIHAPTGQVGFTWY